MNPIQVFSIFANKNKKKDSEPDYVISAKIGEAYQEIGGCWLKESKGQKYFSCKLRSAYQDKKAYVIMESPEGNF